MSHHHHTLAPSGQGTVMLNIGGGIGALIIYTPGRLHGHEIEVSPAGAPQDRTHAAVRARFVRGGVTFCVVLDALPEGRYLVWQQGDTPLAEVEVRGGTVAEFTWPAVAVPGRTPVPV
ncbi:phospholipase [Actinoplanes sp. DH11]|uniref:phospholipase n=1 Tax=Actinoplanes sp. DH11 TaxID=2857011 RepID=UPI001E30BD3C|nr:phospholipase [Actinoplanes sp. DH11]